MGDEREEVVDSTCNDEQRTKESLLLEVELLKMKLTLLTATTCSKCQQNCDGSDDKAELDVRQMVAEVSSSPLDFNYVQSLDMYYHYKTGYYFHDDSCLFFDPIAKQYLMFNPRTSQYQPSKVNDKNEESKEAVDSVMTDILTREMTANDHEPKHEDEKAEVVKTSPSKYVYDTNSGYFFNPVSGMFFEPISRRYFKYDPDSNSHYEVLETGERVESQNGSHHTSEFTLETSSIRLVVLDSQSLNLGTLFFASPTSSESDILIGKNKRCNIYLPSYCVDSVEQFHCKLRPDKDDNVWTIRTVNEKCRAVLNGKKLEPFWTKLTHGVNLELGSLKLAVHIHCGYNVTCDGCEPALVEAFFAKKKRLETTNSETNGAVNMNGESVGIETQRRRTTHLIKESLGLNTGRRKLPVGYEDRAETRRQVVGSEPSIGYSKETKNYSMTLDEICAQHPSSTDKPLDSNNVGFKLLKSMGYKEGKGLGKEGKGISEPIKVQLREPRAGLSSASVKFSLDDQEKASKYHKQWGKALKRFAELEKN